MAVQSISPRCSSYLNYLNECSSEILLRSYQGGLCMEDVKKIADAVRNHPRLTSLTLDGRPLFVRSFAFVDSEEDLTEISQQEEDQSSPQFAIEIVKALQGSSTLEKLSLARLRSDEISWDSIDQLLKTTPSLFRFSILDILIDRHQLGSLCDAICSSSHLAHLSIKAPLTTAQMIVLADFLIQNPALESLDIDAGEFSKEEKGKIQNALLNAVRLNGSLWKLHVNTICTNDLKPFFIRNIHNIWQKKVSLFSLLADAHRNFSVKRSIREIS